MEFVNCLCAKFDFESAQQKLAKCQDELAMDFFLCKQTDLFMEEALVFVFENYCRTSLFISYTSRIRGFSVGDLSCRRQLFGCVRKLCTVYSLNLNTIAIFHDPARGMIAFNSNRFLYMNVCASSTLVISSRIRSLDVTVTPAGSRHWLTNLFTTWVRLFRTSCLQQ